MDDWYWSIDLSDIWLVVSTPLKNLSQLGIIPNICKNNPNVPNHQPDIDWINDFEWYWRWFSLLRLAEGLDFHEGNLPASAALAVQPQRDAHMMIADDCSRWVWINTY